MNDSKYRRYDMPEYDLICLIYARDSSVRVPHHLLDVRGARMSRMVSWVSHEKASD